MLAARAFAASGLKPSGVRAVNSATTRSRWTRFHARWAASSFDSSQARPGPANARATARASPPRHTILLRPVIALLHPDGFQGYERPRRGARTGAIRG